MAINSGLNATYVHVTHFKPLAATKIKLSLCRTSNENKNKAQRNAQNNQLPKIN
jgi:hypothetical protein